MNDPNYLFSELFCNPSNKHMALLYLASLMSETERDEDYQTKIRQISLLRNFFEGIQCSKGLYYLQWLSAIEVILEQDRAHIAGVRNIFTEQD